LEKAKNPNAVEEEQKEPGQSQISVHEEDIPFSAKLKKIG
jgi:hypothetical protein